MPKKKQPNVPSGSSTPTSKPTEVYGPASGPVNVAVANGGAGPTGIIRALAEDYVKANGNNFFIAWYESISKNSIYEVENNIVDMAWVYVQAEIDAAVKAGYGKDGGVVFNDHFLIVGPKSNPAKLATTDTANQAFQKIASTQSKFFSRDDGSATIVKEHSIWAMLSLTPWEGTNSWYEKKQVFPPQALQGADKDNAYTLTDRGTWLSNMGLIKNLDIYIQGSPLLLNPCSCLLRQDGTADAQKFWAYLMTDRAQTIIKNFGMDTHNGFALFTPSNQMDFSSNQSLPIHGASAGKRAA